jgi:hypothetical protein
VAHHVNDQHACQHQHIIFPIGHVHATLKALPSTKKTSWPSCVLIVKSSPQQNNFCFTPIPERLWGCDLQGVLLGIAQSFRKV